MNRRIVQAVSFLLFAAVLAASLFSCAEKPVPGTDTLPPSASDTAAPETLVTADLPDLDLDGYLFSVAHWFLAGWECRRNIDVYAEALNGEPINDAVYHRNSLLTEKYDFEIEYNDVTEGELYNKVRQFVSTGDDVYDVVYVLLAETPSLSTGGCFLDFETSFDYCDYDKPYWDASVRKELSFAEHTYLMASSYNIHDEDATTALAFNKQIAADENIPNVYEIVNAGNWTFDTLHSLMTSFNGDVNGDQKMNHEDDVFGFLGGNDVATTFFFGGEGRLTEKDEYDFPVYVFDTEENFDIYSSVLDIMYDPMFLNHHMIGNENDVYFRQMFIDGHGLFYWMRMDDARAMRGEEAINFGILPIPKYDDLQSDYHSLLSRHTSGLMSVLMCEQNPDTVGFIMEAMAAASYYDLTRAYYDVTLKTKATRDDESQDMLDIIFANRVIDIGDIFNFGGFADTILSYARTNPGKYNIASTFASQKNQIQSAMDKFYEQIEKLDLYA